MPSRKVKQLIDVFRNHFQEEAGGSPPLALRQESTDVVFVALLEDDAPVTPGPSPLIIEEPSLGGDPLGELGAHFGPAMAQALGAQDGAGGDLAAMLGLDPAAGAAGPQAASGEAQEGGMPSGLDELLGGMM